MNALGKQKFQIDFDPNMRNAIRVSEYTLVIIPPDLIDEGIPDEILRVVRDQQAAGSGELVSIHARNPAAPSRSKDIQMDFLLSGRRRPQLRSRFFTVGPRPRGGTHATLKEIEQDQIC